MAVYAGPNLTETGLIFYYDISNKKSYPGTGTGWFDLSGNNFTASLINGTTFSNGNLTFDGSNDYVLVGNDAKYNGLTGDFTLDIWWRTSNPSKTLNYVISNARDCCGTYNGFDIMCFGPVSKFLFAWWNGTSSQWYSNTVIAANTWYNLVVSFSGTVANCYINGAFDVQKTSLVLGSPASYNLVLGGMGAFPSFYTLVGNLNVAKMYNRALSASEILDNYNSMRGRFNL